MKYSIGQKVNYKTIGGKIEGAIIIAVKSEGENGTIKTERASGNFDYLVAVEKDGTIEEHFCMERDIL